MERKDIIDRFLERGVLIGPRALDRALGMPPEVLDKAILDLESRGVQVAQEEDLDIRQPEEKAPSLEIEIEMGGAIASSDSRLDYLKHFQNRFDRLASLIRKAKSFEESQNIIEVKSGKGGATSIIGMVSDRKVTPEGHLVLVIEDGTGNLRAFVAKNSPAIKAANKLVLDEVIGVQGRYEVGKKIFIIRKIVFPDIENQITPLSPERILVAFLSDLHFGSEEFMEEAFSRFIEWLNGRFGDTELRELGKLTRGLVLCGDLIEGGNGDPLERYKDLASILKEIPDGVRIFAIPGEHDTAGILEPAGFLDEAVNAFSDLENFLHGSNPCMVRLNSVPVLLYHGRSLEDWALSLDVSDSCDLMKEMLIRRHIAPIYGTAVPLVPTSKDPFLIAEVPRIFCIGHSHRKCSDKYKGVLLLSPSSWKSSEREKGSGTIHLVDLSTLETRDISFAP